MENKITWKDVAIGSAIGIGIWLLWDNWRNKNNPSFNLFTGNAVGGMTGRRIF